MLFQLFGFLNVHYWDIIDILFVTFVFYKMLQIIRDMKATPMFTGLILVILSSFAAAWLQLSALMWFIDTLKTIWVVAFLIIFQPELRRALSKIGQSRWFQFMGKTEDDKVFDIISNAAENMSKKKTGALIVLIKEASLASIIETGTKMNCLISEPVIETVFFHLTPLHDGAMIVQGDQIIACACTLPITQNINLDKRLGLRHRAALGISEESDAVAVVVSEETGHISLARGGLLTRNLTCDELKKELSKEFLKNEINQTGWKRIFVK